MQGTCNNLSVTGASKDGNYAGYHNKFSYQKRPKNHNTKKFEQKCVLGNTQKISMPNKVSHN